MLHKIEKMNTNFELRLSHFTRIVFRKIKRKKNRKCTLFNDINKKNHLKLMIEIYYTKWHSFVIRGKILLYFYLLES